MKLIRKNDGFSLVELMIALVAFLFVVYSASNIFSRFLTQFKQQTKIAEMNIEGLVGLEMLRQDIFHAGFGLPWEIPGVVTYIEATQAAATPYNDSTTSDPPRGILSGDNVGTLGSDYLVVKATAVGMSDASRKYTKLFWDNTVEERDDPREIMDTGDYVIVLSPGQGVAGFRKLVHDAGDFDTTYVNGVNDSLIDGSNEFRPPDPAEIRWVYGVSPSGGADPRMPFNRADYYISVPASLPTHCANPGTGVLYKSVISHNDGGYGIPLPLLDCVADFQVAFGIDSDSDGSINCYTNDLANVLPTVDAKTIRQWVREVRVYVLSHEGQVDSTYEIGAAALNGACANCIRAGESAPPQGVCEGGILGRDVDLSALGLTQWRNYRWRVNSFIVYPYNLSGKF